MAITPTSTGYRTPGFWVTLAVTLATALGAAGVVPSILDQPVQLILASLATAGYTALRTFAKGDGSKPAWKTTEFWLSAVAAVVAALVASGVFRQGGLASQILAWAATLLAALGYGVGRQLGRTL